MLVKTILGLHGFLKFGFSRRSENVLRFHELGLPQTLCLRCLPVCWDPLKTWHGFTQVVAHTCFWVRRYVLSTKSEYWMKVANNTLTFCRRLLSASISNFYLVTLSLANDVGLALEFSENCTFKTHGMCKNFLAFNLRQLTHTHSLQKSTILPVV